MSGLEEQRERARAARESLIGKTVAGKYTLRAVIGHGGMGAVYEAEHTGIGKRVAVKFIDPEFATDERVVARFAREARAMSSIESAHIVTVFDAGTEDGRPYLIMELLRGEDLGQRLRRTRRVPADEALHIVAQVLKGLARAHAAGIVHRDLKPDNVFLTKSDLDPVFAKIVDFGISKIERPRENTSPLALTGRGTVLGTPFYMSPEQAQCATDTDQRADIYSVGAMLFECLTGRPPHTGESYEQVILSICMKDAPNIRVVEPNISAELAAFVMRALARDKVQRYPSAERMLAALHEIAPEERRRVPLDAPAAQTLHSVGVVTPVPPSGSHPISSKTRLGIGTLADGSNSHIPIAPTASQAPPTEKTSPPSAEVSSIDIPGLPKKKKRGRSMTPAIVTAVLATLTGLGATAGIISALDKNPADAPAASTSPKATTTAPPATLTSATSEPLASPPTPSTTASPPNVVRTTATTAPPTAVKAPPRPPPPATTKKLDINRELP